MATLLMTIDSSDDEDGSSSSFSRNLVLPTTKKEETEETEETEDEEVDSDFEFGGVLGEDGDGNTNHIPSTTSTFLSNNNEKEEPWSYKSALAILAQQDNPSNSRLPERMNVASIIAAARKNMKSGVEEEEDLSLQHHDQDDEDEDEDEKEEESDSEDESNSNSESNSESNSNSDSESDSDDEMDDNDAAKTMETDIVREQIRTQKSKNPSTTNHKHPVKSDANQKEDKDTNEGSEEDKDHPDSDHPESDSDNDSESDDDESDEDEDAKEEAAKAAAFFDNSNPSQSSHSSHHDTTADDIQIFSQLNLSRPLLRGVASMGYVTPTPIQASVIPSSLAGRDICASAVTGSGKTAAFVLPILEHILQRSHHSKSRSITRALIITPTRELAAQCYGMVQSLCRYCRQSIRSCLIVGGNRNIPSQAAELRTHPEIIICTPGRMLDHLTNSAGVELLDLECLVLDEADRLLDLGFQEEILEIVKSCPSSDQRQTLLFSATMTTKVDDLVKLSMKRPLRVKISHKPTDGTTSASAGVEIAPKLEQEFIRIRSSNEQHRDAILLSLLTRTFQKLRTIVFFDTKNLCHRLRIICGLCGIACAELHGNLTQTQRLEALEEFRQGEVNVLLATDLAARGLDISGVQAVLNFDMPKNVETYVHRIGRTARAGRGGRSCTMIGEERRILMKEVMKDAEEKNKISKHPTKGGGTDVEHSQTAVIRSRTVPMAVIAHFRAKINSLETHVKEVLAAEVVAKMDRLAEMEATRASNIILHGDEIRARPAREWFKGNNEKKADEERLRKMREEKMINQEGSGKHRMTRKKRRLREAKESLKYFQEQERQEREDKNLDPLPMVSDRSIKAQIRSDKKEEQQRQKEYFERTVHDEDVYRHAKLEKKRKKELKRKKKVGQDSVGDSSLFDSEKITYAKKPKMDQAVAPKSDYHFRGFDPDKQFGKGGKKSKHAFKSRSKYKRR